MIPEDELANHAVFLDCLSVSVVSSLAPATKKTTKKRAGKGRKNEIKPVEKADGNALDDGNDAAELSEFIEVGQRQ